MTAQLEAAFMAATKPVGMVDDYHRYYFNGVGPLPSVTTILKLQDALMGDGLTTWAAGIASDYILNMTLPVPLDKEGIKAQALQRVNAARDTGSAVHGQIADILNGIATTPTPITAPFVYQFATFLAAKRPEFLHTEQVVLSPSNGYAGRFDFIAKINGRTALVDVKTGKLKPSHRLQLAGYAAADFIGKPDDPTEYPIPRLHDYYVLLLRADSYELVPLKVTRSDRAHFLTLTKTYRRAAQWAREAA